MNAQEKRERELAAFLAGETTELDVLYRKLAKPEPDGKLDSAVLTLARRALGANNVAAASPTSTANERLSRAYRRPAPSRWVVGLGSAAGLVLAAGLAWRVGTSPSNRPGENALPSASAPATTTAEKTDSKSNVVEVNPISPGTNDRTAAKTPPAAVPATTVNPFGSDEKKLVQPTPVPQKSPAMQPEVRPRDAADSAGYASPTGITKQSLRAAPEPPPPPILKEEKIASPQREPEPFSEVTQRAKAASAPSSHATVSNAAVAGAAGKMKRHDESDKSLSTHSAPAPKAQIPAQSPVATEAAPAAAPTDQVDTEKSKVLEAARWIAQIRKMLRDHRGDEAVMNLKQFREHYPDYPLPADLRDLVQ